MIHFAIYCKINQVINFVIQHAIYYKLTMHCRIVEHFPFDVYEQTNEGTNRTKVRRETNKMMIRNMR